MSTSAAILDYSSPQPAPSHLTLEESDGVVRVIFPALPIWWYVLDIATGIVLGLNHLVVGIVAIVLLSEILGLAGPSGDNAAASHQIEAGAIGIVVIGLIFWIIAIHKWRKYRRWGRVPRVLTATNEALVSTRLGFFRMRERRWAASEISSIELRVVKPNFNWKKTVVNLYVHRYEGRRLRFRLSSADPQLPGRIAERLASMLGCSLLP